MLGVERKSKISLTLIAFPLVFIIAAIAIFFNVVRNMDILNTTDTVVATVVQVEYDSYWDSDNEHHDVYHTYVNYEYGEKKYDNIYIGTISLKRDVGDHIKIKVSKDNPQNAYTVDLEDVFFPLLGAAVFAILGIVLLVKFLKWQIDDMKEAKSKGYKTARIAFKIPSKGEFIVGLALALLVTLFVVLSIYVLNGLVIGAVAFGFFLILWADACIVK